jgi:NAD(P)-dependent dehydrogenase (short-subunit alcohol dehydrogenase family)
VAYGTLKAAINGLTRQLAIDHGPEGVRVNAVLPGNVRTAVWDAVDAETERVMTASVPLRRIADPREIAAAVAFLASDEASYVTGSCLVVDGGWLASSRVRLPGDEHGEGAQ